MPRIPVLAYNTPGVFIRESPELKKLVQWSLAGHANRKQGRYDSGADETPTILVLRIRYLFVGCGTTICPLGTER